MKSEVQRQSKMERLDDENKKTTQAHSHPVPRIGAAEPIVDESEPLEKEESQKIKDQAAAMQRIANLLNGKKP